MSLSTICLLIFIALIGIFSFVLLELNETVVNLDLLFLDLDLQLGFIILASTICGILVALALEILYSFSKRHKND